MVSSYKILSLKNKSTHVENVSAACLAVETAVLKLQQGHYPHQDERDKRTVPQRVGMQGPVRKRNP